MKRYDCSQNPGSAIPKGTLLAIFTTTASYIAFVLLMGAATLRYATGPDSNDTITDSLAESWEFANCTDVDCEWGSHNSFQVARSCTKSFPSHFFNTCQLKCAGTICRS